MGNLELTVLLVFAVGAMGWLVYRVVASLSAGSESSARADTLGQGSGLAAEQMDNVRNLDR